MCYCSRLIPLRIRDISTFDYIKLAEVSICCVQMKLKNFVQK